MTQSPRLDRRASIALSVAFAYAVCASVAYPLGIRLLPWIYLPALLAVALPLAFAASLLAGARIYTFRPGRLATFARFCLVLLLLVTAVASYVVVSDSNGIYMLFDLAPLLGLFGIIGIPAWLIAVARSAR